jgi:Na+/serine symporter
MTQLTEWVKLAGLAYAIGFTVILVHTARLNGPVVDAFQFQNILAGLPVWLVLALCLSLWPRFREHVAIELGSGDKDRNLADIAVAVILILGIVIADRVLFWVIRQSSVTPVYISAAAHVLIVSGITTVAFGSIAVPALWKTRNGKSPSLRSFGLVLTLFGTYSASLTLVLAYALYPYPLVPQSLGGGHPTQVRIYYKDHGLTPLLGGTATTGEQDQPSDPVALYYRTSSYLLVRSPKSPSLLQVPMDQVHTIVWLESR